MRQAFNQMLDELSDVQKRLVQTATLATVGELSSSIVHEMRNPLSSIKINLQALHKKVEGDANHEELAQIASQQVGRLEEMLRDLLQYGRPVEFRTVSTPFSKVYKETLNVIGDMAESKKVRIDLEDLLGSARLSVDPELVCRALTNLAANAIQAAPPGGLVTVRVSADPAGAGQVIIEVIDNGSGLSPQALRGVFKPFFTTRKDGTGLGLANVKKIVELHGGTVSAYNRPENGAVFTVTLPSRVLVNGPDSDN